MQAILAGASLTPFHTLTLTPELNFSSRPPTWSFSLLFFRHVKKTFAIQCNFQVDWWSEWGDIVDSGVLALFGRGGDGFAWGRPYAVLANPMYMVRICSSNSAKQRNTWKPTSAWSTQWLKDILKRLWWFNIELVSWIFEILLVSDC